VRLPITVDDTLLDSDLYTLDVPRQETHSTTSDTNNN